MVITAGAIAAVAAFMITSSADTRYSARATILVDTSPGIEERIFGEPASQDTALELANAYEELRVEGESVAAAFPESSISVQIEGVASTPGGSSISVTGESPQPKSAAKAANTTAERFVESREEEGRARAKAARIQLEEELQGLSPEERTGRVGRRAQLGILKLKSIESSLEGNVSISQAATVPPAPERPIARNTIFGGISGLLVGAAIVILLALFRRRLETPEDIERALGLPLLAEIPRDDRLNLGNSDAHAEGALEPIRLLLAGLRRLPPAGSYGSLLLTSAGAGEGKTTIGWSLATTAAVAGVRTVLIEADMRTPTFATRHDLIPSPGIGDLLGQQVDFGGVVQTVTTADRQSSFDVVVAGSPPVDPGALLARSDLQGFLQKLTDAYELVIIDAPPLGFIADSIPLLSLVDRLLVIARCGQVTEYDFERLSRQLEGFPNEPGLAANFSPGISRVKTPE